MANYKLILDDEFTDDFSVIAIHCSEEAYKLAFLINKKLGLQLHRRKTDLEFSADGLEVTFPLFQYYHEEAYIGYDLVANKCKSIVAHTASSGGLFNDTEEETVITYLVPDFKNVDFFLKITSEGGKVSLKKMTTAVHEIAQVISGYEIDVDSLKNKNNLIFD